MRLAVLCSSPSTVASSPWKTAMICSLSLLTSSGLSICISGRKPLKRTVRSSAGRVASRPKVCPALISPPVVALAGTIELPAPVSDPVSVACAPCTTAR